MDDAGLHAMPRKPFFERNVERAMWVLVLAATAVIRRTREGRRVYFEPAGFPWAASLEAGWRDARAELESVLAERSLPTFQAVSEEQYAITRDGGWRVFVFSIFGHPIAKNTARCPRTAALLAGIPGLRNAMFSVLAPGKRIPPHRGVYAGLLRYHLALIVPPPSAGPCAITVDGEERPWAEGATLIFDDSYEHSVRNDTPHERVVLFADFVRPLPWPASLVNRAVLRVLSFSPLFRKPLEKFERGEL